MKFLRIATAVFILSNLLATSSAADNPGKFLRGIHFKTWNFKSSSISLNFSRPYSYPKARRVIKRRATKRRGGNILGRLLIKEGSTKSPSTTSTKPPAPSTKAPRVIKRRAKRRGGHTLGTQVFNKRRKHKVT